jgi:hypothetical protein
MGFNSAFKGLNFWNHYAQGYQAVQYKLGFQLQSEHNHYSFIHSFISNQPLGRFQQEPEPSQATGLALAHCILGKFLGVGCHCFPPTSDVPTFSARCLHVQRRQRPLAAEGGTLRGREMFRLISSRIRLPRNSRDLLHAANLRHGTDGFTSPPKEGVLLIFSPLKIQRLRPGLNPRTWVPKCCSYLFVRVTTCFGPH